MNYNTSTLFQAEGMEGLSEDAEDEELSADEDGMGDEDSEEAMDEDDDEEDEDESFDEEGNDEPEETGTLLKSVHYKCAIVFVFVLFVIS